MKRILLSLVLFALVGFGSTLNAQCNIVDVTTSNSIKFQLGSDCYVKFDLTLVAQLNGGNKAIWFHFWDANNYPTSPWNYGTGVPSAAFLATSGALGTLGVDNSGATPVILNSYPFDNSQPVVMVTANQPTVSATGSGGSTTYTYLFTDVTLKLANCSDPIPSILADVWSTNASSLGPNTKSSCTIPRKSLNIGDLSLSLSNPFKVCGSSARGLNFTVSTNSSTTINAVIEIHQDDNVLQNNQEVYNPSTDLNVTVPSTGFNITLSAGSPYIANNIQYFSTFSTLGENSNYWVVVKFTPAGGSPYNIANMSTNACAAPLPVSFKSITATRNNQTVAVKWETATEVNSKGFYVQRNDNGVWKNVAFVFSAANGGNSDQVLSYQFNDPNNSTGVSQYRIQQIDIDMRAKFSEIRSVRGLEQLSKLMVYPNPSSDGKINLLFGDETTLRDVLVSDAAGRIIKSYKNLSANSLTLENLLTGMYTIQVKDLSSSKISYEKFVVQK